MLGNHEQLACRHRWRLPLNTDNQRTQSLSNMLCTEGKTDKNVSSNTRFDNIAIFCTILDGV